MTTQELRQIIEDVLDQVYELKNRYLSEPLGHVDYVGIAPAQPTELINFLKTLSAKTVYTDDWGSVYQLSTPIDMKYRPINLIKICHPDGKPNRKSYADFQTNNYDALNKKYAGKPNFLKMYGDGWEILGIKDTSSPVSLFIPNVPLSHDLKL